MRYMLVNVSTGNLQVDLRSPEIEYKNKNLNRPGKVASINIIKGDAVNILPYFDASVEKAHKSVKYSRDVLRLLKPTLLHIYVCDDEGQPIDIEKFFGKKESKKSEKEDITKPDLELSEVLAAQDQFEAKKAGEVESDAEEKSDTKGKSSKKKSKKASKKAV